MDQKWVSPSQCIRVQRAEDLDHLLLGMSLNVLKQEDKPCGGRYPRQI